MMTDVAMAEPQPRQTVTAPFTITDEQPADAADENDSDDSSMSEEVTSDEEGESEEHGGNMTANGIVETEDILTW